MAPTSQAEVSPGEQPPESAKVVGHGGAWLLVGPEHARSINERQDPSHPECDTVVHPGEGV
eukprot:10401463-Alexandrium_andersonii.AAC.1